MQYHFVTALIDGGKPVAPEQLSNKQQIYDKIQKKIKSSCCSKIC